MFIVRNRQNRRFICSNIGKINLQTRLNQVSEKKEIIIEVPKKKNETAREANIEVKYISGLIPIRSPSLYGSKKHDHKISDRVAVYVIRAKEIDPPKGSEAID